MKIDDITDNLNGIPEGAMADGIADGKKKLSRRIRRKELRSRDKSNNT